MIRFFRYRIYPTKRQRETLEDHLAICCELYNAALQERREAWKRERKSISWFDQNLQLKDIRANRQDVAEVNATALEWTLRRLHLAFEAFFRRVRRGNKPGYPRFRSLRRYDSLTLRNVGDCLRGSRVRISKVGWVRIKLSRALTGPIKTLTIKREANRWFALFAVECDPVPLPFNPNAIGIDVGLSWFATLSNGEAIENPRWFKAAEAKLRRTQRRVARRKKGSNRRRKAVLLLQRCHNHIRDQRRDFLHKLSRRLVNERGLIAVENLNIGGLASGMLAKSVNDASWSTFIDMLAYKAESAGRVLVKVDPRGTSQTCTCGARVRKTLKQRWHLCLDCGLSLSRDHVSAQIILSRARGEPSGANVAEVVASVA